MYLFKLVFIFRSGCLFMFYFDEEEMGYFLILFIYFESKLFFVMGKN